VSKCTSYVAEKSVLAIRYSRNKMEEGMQKLIGACLLLVIFSVLQSAAFAAPLNCKFKDSAVTVEGIKTLQITDDALVINDSSVIYLSHTKIKCGAFGRQHRFDGFGKGLQIILKSCTDSAVLSGHIIDSISSKVAEVICD
jgi:hypothetical protein